MDESGVDARHNDYQSLASVLRLVLSTSRVTNTHDRIGFKFVSENRERGTSCFSNAFFFRIAARGTGALVMHFIFDHLIAPALLPTAGQSGSNHRRLNTCKAGRSWLIDGTYGCSDALLCSRIGHVPPIVRRSTETHAIAYNSDSPAMYVSRCKGSESEHLADWVSN